MTEQEAIEELKYDCGQLGKAIPCDTSCGQAINTAYGMAIAALERRIPKKPSIKPDKYCDLIQHYYCPTCGRYFGQRGIHNVILFSKERYCQGDGCGQALDWREE